MARILRELIELAEYGEDAELVDALREALDVASPAPASMIAPRTTIRTTSSGLAPMAKRRPISRVRCAVATAITPVDAEAGEGQGRCVVVNRRAASVSDDRNWSTLATL